MVTSFELVRAVGAGSLAREVIRSLLVGTNATFAPQVMRAFAVSIHSAFAVPAAFGTVAMCFSPGRENRTDGGSRAHRRNREDP